MSTETTQQAVAVVTDETLLTEELVDRIFKLSHSERLRLRDIILFTPDVPEGTQDEIQSAQRREIGHRLEAIERGEMKMSTIDETFAFLDSLVAQRAES
jgi:hypothetical protein